MASEVGAARSTTAPDGGTRTLAEEQRDVARARIVEAAKGALAARGLATTVDDVAEAAGVSRRTVFRHFATRENLFATAIRDGLHAYGGALPVPPPAGSRGDDEDLSAWLLDLLLAAHRMNTLTGRVYWELTLDGDLSGELAAVAAERRDADQRFSTGVAAVLWTTRGGPGRPPRWFTDTVSVHLSGYSTQALAGVFGRQPDDIACVAQRAIEAALAAALAEADASR